MKYKILEYGDGHFEVAYGPFNIFRFMHRDDIENKLYISQYLSYSAAEKAIISRRVEKTRRKLRNLVVKEHKYKGA